MTASAGFYPQDNPPPLFNFGALFGLSPKSQTSYVYKPPSLRKQSPLDSSTQTLDHVPNDESRDSITDGSSAEQNTTRYLPPAYANVTEAWNKHTESAVTKHNACKVQAADVLSVGGQDFEDCLEAFKAGLATAKDSQADLDGVFMQHLPSTPLLWRYYAATLQHVCHQGHNPEPVLRCLLQDNGHLLRRTSPFENVSHCAEFTERLGVIAQTDDAHGIFEMLALMAVDADNSATEAHDLVILRLIEHTSRHESLSLARKRSHALASKLRPSTDNKLLISHFPYGKNVQHVILSTVRRVSEASCDFASAERALFYMPRQQLLGLVPKITSSFVNLRKDGSGKDRWESASSSINQRRLDIARDLDVWLQLLHRLDTRASDNGVLLETAMIPLAKALGGLWFNQRAVLVLQDFFFRALLLRLNIHADIPLTTEKSRRVQALFADVLLQMKAGSTEYTALLDLALPLIAQYAGLPILVRCIRTMEELRLPLSTQMDFNSFLADQTAKLKDLTPTLSESEVQNRALALQSCEKLVSALNRMGHTLPARMEEIATLSGLRQFTNLLLLAKKNSALPIAIRDASTDLPLLERVGLIHQLAYHYSQDTTRTQRQIWRSIYYMYRHLRANLLPVGPLLTKAIVQASITRPLAENQFVSARRLIWVCHLVASVEGDEAAARIENEFWKRRGTLMGHTKRKYVGVGGNKQSKAHIGTMNRLQLL